MEYLIPESPSINYESLLPSLEWMLKNQRQELLTLLNTMNTISAYGYREQTQSTYAGNLLSFFKGGNTFTRVNDFGGDNLLTFNFGNRLLIANGKRVEWFPNLNSISTIPPWLRFAYKEIGTAENKSFTVHNPRIIEYHSITSGKFQTDEIPWCGAFVGWCLNKAGLPLPKIPERAKDWKNWSSGKAIPKPAYGCLVVIEYPGGGGHVGFGVGYDTKNRLLFLGGNQGDKVSIAPMGGHVIAYMWPSDVPVTPFGKIMTTLDSTAAVATSR